MKISVVTVSYNAAATLSDTIHSVAAQSYHDVEHILIDGASTDNSMDIVMAHQDHFQVVVSEQDEGLYHAMNKGIELARGDVVGILNADDFYTHKNVLRRVAQVFENDSSLDACYADLIYVNAVDTRKVVRYWQSQSYQSGLIERGWMPAHPTLFLKRSIYEQVGLFNLSLKYQSDFEMMARLFVKHGIDTQYIPDIWVTMRMGGTTNKSLMNIIRGNLESYQACKRLNIKLSPLHFVTKFMLRLPQFFRKPPAIPEPIV